MQEIKKESYPEKPRAFKRLFYKQVALVFFSFIFLLPYTTSAQELPCEEVPLTLKVEGVGQIELFSLLCGEEAYISVPELFDFLQIKNTPASDYSSIEGFLKNQNDTFVIDAATMEAIYGNKKTILEKESLRTTPTNLYLRADHFAEIFGLGVSTSIRTMSMALDLSFELPSLKAARREKLRENLQRLKRGPITADTSISREKAIFHMGVADYNLYATQGSNGQHRNSATLGLGGLLAGGEFTTRLNYNSEQPLRSRNQFYRWRYVNNENKIFRQITAGKIRSNSIASLYDPVIGVQVTNAPTYLKKSFGTYVLSDYTEPDWMVELYINNVLVDFVQADASGFFSFDVPLMYGSTAINLRYYGPYGEEKFIDKRFSIPFMLLKKNDFEYSLSSGIVEDGENNKFAQARVNYGLTNTITLGGGVEYLSALEKNPVIPFINTAIRLPHNMLLSGEYSHKVGFKGNFSYTSPSSLRLELNYKKYEEEQEAVRFSYLEERELKLSFPVNFGEFRGTSRFTLRQNMMRSGSNFNPQWFLSARAYGLNFNLTTNAYITEYSDPFVYSRLSSSIRLPKGINFTPEVRYEFNTNSLSSLKGELRKQFSSRGYLRTSFEQNLKMDQTYFNIGLTYEIGGARVGLSGNTNGKQSSITETLSGSILFDPKQKHLEFSKQSSLDRANVKFIAFLDIDGDGKRGALEPQLQGLKVTATNGGQKKETPDGATTFTGLEPYIPHHFTLNTDGLNRIAWRVKNRSLNIQLNPNQIKLVEIPVSVIGEVAGFVYDQESQGIGGIKINILGSDNTLVKQLISEPDGFFSFLGLKSGTYRAAVDSVQLEMLQLRSNTPFSFTIENTEEGDIVDALEFQLQALEEKESDTLSEIVSKEMEDVLQEAPNAQDSLNLEIPEQQLAEKDTSAVDAINLKEGLVFKVQIAASKTALDLQEAPFAQLEGLESYQHDGSYKYTLGSYTSFVEANELKNQLRVQGFPDAFVVPFFNNARLNPWMVEGKVSLETPHKVGIGGIKIIIYNSRKERIGVALSETDGRFSVPGLLPGSYTAALESAQLEQINMLAEKGTQDFSIGETTGISLEQLEFLLVSKEAEEDGVKATSDEKTASQGLMFKVQVLASNPRLSVNHRLLKGLEGVERHEHNGMYKYTWGAAGNLKEARQLKKEVSALGFEDAFIVSFYNGKRMGIQEASGHIYLQAGEERNGMEGIKINILDQHQQLVTTLVSETDGVFNFLGLKPGAYLAQLVDSQLETLGLSTKTASQAFRIGRTAEGMPPLEFVLEKKPTDSITAESIYTDTIASPEPLVYKIQVVASNVRLSPRHPSLKNRSDNEMHVHEGMFKYTIGSTTSLAEAKQLREHLRDEGFSEAFIVVFKEGSRIRAPLETAYW